MPAYRVQRDLLDQLTAKTLELDEAVRRILAEAVPIDEPGPPPPPPPDSDEPAIHVRADGKDSQGGLTPNSAVATIPAALHIWQNHRERCILVGPGTYPPFTIRDAGATAKRPLCIKAEEPWAAEISACRPDVARSGASWRHHADGIYKLPAQAGPWQMFGAGTFLPLFRSLEDLAGSRSMDLKMPRHGFAHQNGEVYVRLPGDEDPRAMGIDMPDSYSAVLVRGVRSPHVILEGFGLIGAGNGPAIVADLDSSSWTIWGCMSTTSRALAQISHNSTLGWNTYTYPGFKDFAEELIKRNGRREAILEYAKSIGQHGDYEGRMYQPATDPRTGKPAEILGVRGYHNLAAEVVDGYGPGLFSDLIEEGSMAVDVYDDGFQIESWWSMHATRNVRLEGCWAVNFQGSAFSVQDSARQIRGPIRLDRCVAINPDERFTPAYVLKIMDCRHRPAISVTQSFLHNRAGRTGWGEVNWIHTGAGRSAGALLSVSDSVLVGEYLTPMDLADRQTYNGNMVMADKAYPEYQGRNGAYGGKPDLSDLYALVSESGFEMPRPLISAAPEAPPPAWAERGS